jgi:hypothetical protein
VLVAVALALFSAVEATMHIGILKGAVLRAALFLPLFVLALPAAAQTPPAVGAAQQTAAYATNAVGFIGKPEPVSCLCSAQQAGGSASAWGTDLYTADSNIRRAAVHAGAIAPAGGVVRFIMGPGQNAYAGSGRNGIATSSWWSFRASIIFLGPLRLSVSGAVPAAASAVQPAKPAVVAGQCPDRARLPAAGTARLSCTCTAAQVMGTGAVWGDIIYTADSALCVSACHAGVIGSNGGKVEIEWLGRQDSFAAATRNGVTTRTFGPWSSSYKFAGTAPPKRVLPPALVNGVPVFTATERNPSGASGRTVCHCTAEQIKNGSSVWGVGLYTTDSSLCRAAVHAGAIDTAGGKVAVQWLGAQQSFDGSTRNGVRTMTYGPWQSSFRFVDAGAAKPAMTARGNKKRGRGAPYGRWVFLKDGKCVDGGDGFVLTSKSITFELNGQTNEIAPIRYRGCKGDTCTFGPRGKGKRWQIRWTGDDRVVLQKLDASLPFDEIEAQREGSADRCEVVRPIK